VGAKAGTLYLVPNGLDFGVPGSITDLQEVLPLGVLRTAARLDHWIAENAKTTRAFLKRVDAVVPLSQALQSISVVELPRPQKGRMRAGTDVDVSALLEPALRGRDVGLISEAGLPAIADPGAAVVAAAHALSVAVIPLPGASALLLALAASGLNGQIFAFVGYLPTEAAARSVRIKELEALSRRLGQSQLMIETPYRNNALFQALVEHLQPETRLAVGCGLTLPGGFARTECVAAWRAQPVTLDSHLPVVFSLLAG
jgi:16S rRNA (cytidine1402-2'-O)-methyltransferase